MIYYLERRHPRRRRGQRRRDMYGERQRKCDCYSLLLLAELVRDGKVKSEHDDVGVTDEILKEF